MSAIRMGRTQRILVGLVVAGAVVIAGIGFAGSYAAVRTLALHKGFGWFANVFPIGVDAGIVVLLSLDLLLTWLRIPFPLLRQTAWLLTAATIAFNGAAAWPDPLGVGMHAVIPVLFVVSVEAARHAVGRIADITADRHMESVRIARWLLAFPSTFRLWRRMKLWELRSYDQVIRLEQDRLVYQARLRARFGRNWRRRAPIESLMPLRLAKYGVPLAETAVAGLAAAGISPEAPVVPVTQHKALTVPPADPTAPAPDAAQAAAQGAQEAAAAQEAQGAPAAPDAARPGGPQGEAPQPQGPGPQGAAPGADAGAGVAGVMAGVPRTAEPFQAAQQFQAPQLQAPQPYPPQYPEPAPPQYVQQYQAPEPDYPDAPEAEDAPTSPFARRRPVTLPQWYTEPQVEGAGEAPSAWPEPVTAPGPAPIPAPRRGRAAATPEPAEPETPFVPDGVDLEEALTGAFHAYGRQYGDQPNPEQFGLFLQDFYGIRNEDGGPLSGRYLRPRLRELTDELAGEMN